MIPFPRSFLLSISLHALLAVLAGAEEPPVVARFREPPPESRNEPGFITLHPAGRRVYLVVRAASGADRNVLYLTDPATRQGKTLPLTPPHAAGGEMLVTEEAAYLYQTADEDRQLAAVARLDRATGQVERKAVPPFSYLGNAVIGDDLYLNLWTGKWSGLMRFNWPTGVATVLADSRRKPRRNQFDDCEDYGTMLLLAGPGGRPVAVVRGQPFFVREEAGDWPPVFAPGESPDAVQLMRPGFWRTAVASRGVLLYSLRGDLVWLDPREKQTVPLIVSEPTGALFPDWKKEARWDEFSFEEMLKSVVVASDRGVFSLHRRPVERGSGYYLRWYRAGRRTAVEMPLEFGKPAKIEGAKGVVADREKAFDVSGTSGFSKPKMTVCEQGLLFSNSFRGFWFLPFTELGRKGSARDEALRIHPRAESGGSPRRGARESLHRLRREVLPQARARAAGDRSRKDRRRPALGGDLSRNKREAKKGGLKPLAHQPEVRKAAAMQAGILAERGVVAHVNPSRAGEKTPYARLQKIGLEPAFAAENVAMVQARDYQAGKPFYTRREDDRLVYSYTPGGKPLRMLTYAAFAAKLLDSWMDSPHHRKNILAPEAEYLGAAASRAAREGSMDEWYAAQVFFTPLRRSR